MARYVIYNFYTFHLILIETDEREDSPVDVSSRNTEKGWSLWGLVRAGWNVKEGSSSPTPDSNPPIRPGQGIFYYRL